MKILCLISITAVILMFNIRAFAENGHETSPSAAYVSVNGLVCDFCARALEKVFGRQDAVESIGVNLDAKIITVHFKPEHKLDDDTIAQLIADAGYHVEEIHHGE